jgi:hypothetical protein
MAIEPISATANSPQIAHNTISAVLFNFRDRNSCISRHSKYASHILCKNVHKKMVNKRAFVITINATGVTIPNSVIITKNRKLADIGLRKRADIFFIHFCHPCNQAVIPYILFITSKLF